MKTGDEEVKESWDEGVEGGDEEVEEGRRCGLNQEEEQNS